MNLEAAKNCGVIHTYDKGQFLCKEGEPGDTAFIVLKGSAAVVIKSYTSNPEIVAKLLAGSFTGEMSLFLKKPRSASIMVMEDSTITLEIKEANFINFLSNDPDTCYKLLKTLVERIDNMLEKLNKYEPRIVFQYKKNEVYQIANGVNPVSFNQMASTQPRVAIKLIMNLCSALDDFNVRYTKATTPQ